jgi:hypothetical protein
MSEIGENTCIQFRDRAEESNMHSSWLDIKNKWSGGNSEAYCYVHDVGRVEGPNPVVLDRGIPGRGCINRRTITHELLHKLGLHHEQNRYDRDYFVIVQNQYIEICEKI